MLAFSPDLEVNCFGHVGDGNLHYNIFPRTNGVRQRLESKRKIIIEIINNIVDELSGSLSAEHGIGRIKSQELFQYENEGKLNAMISIKSALDPNGILNPGVIFKDTKDL